MEKKPLYTIGHGSRKIDDFLKILKDFNIEYLLDIRSQPYSKFNPQYNQIELKYFLERNDITYVFMGDTIGGRPTDRTCYDEEGKVDYEIVKTKEFFIQGVSRLKTAYEKEINAVIMCSESKPCECHRSKLIGRVLQNDKVVLKHIDEKGKVKDQLTVINELNKGKPEINLFGEIQNATSRKAYI
jgi:uncharacterized protein (DUF488 family)